MYIVKIKNGADTVEIHNENIKLSSGQIVKGINTIDSFSFSASPNNLAFAGLEDFQTLVTVYNTAKRKYEYYGRVLCSSISMSDNGLLKREATCESYFGFLCDSVQTYVAEKNWTVNGLLTHIINTHNSLVEDYKQFKIGEITVTDPNDNVYIGIQRENTWETISKKLIEKLGGEIRFRVEDDGIYIDYLEQIGEEKETEIALSRNMKSITKENDPSSFVTRLIPLGAKLSNDSEERLTIASANNGVIYIDDTEAIKKYGIHTRYVEFDDITTASGLLTAGRNWLTENNKVLIKYSITALDLSLIGLDIDDFEVYNSHPIKNALLGIDDIARITKQTIDICDETKKSFEIGDSFKTLSELQRDKSTSIINKVNADIAVIIRDYVTNEKLQKQLTETVTSTIQQQEESIMLKVEAGYISNDDLAIYAEVAAAELELKVGKDENDQIVSMLNASANEINIKGNRLKIDSDNFKLSEDGTMTVKNADITNAKVSGIIETPTGKIGGWTLSEQEIMLRAMLNEESVTRDEDGNYEGEGEWETTILEPSLDSEGIIREEWVTYKTITEIALSTEKLLYKHNTYSSGGEDWYWLKVYLTPKGVYAQTIKRYKDPEGQYEETLTTTKTSWHALVESTRNEWTGNENYIDKEIFGEK